MSEKFNTPAQKTGSTNIYDTYALYEIGGKTRDALKSIVVPMYHGDPVNQEDIDTVKSNLGYGSFVRRQNSTGTYQRYSTMAFHIPVAGQDRFFLLSPLSNIGEDDDHIHFVPEDGRKIEGDERKTVISWIQLSGGTGNHLRLEQPNPVSPAPTDGSDRYTL